MKNFLQFIKKIIRTSICWFLRFLARSKIKRLGLFVIGITGSIGKTSTKEAIYTILKSKYQVYRSTKSYNTDMGLPLAILEQTSGFSSVKQWLKVLFSGIWNALFGGRHLQMVILEMGVDKPGDMDVLLKIAKPLVSVITNIKPVHLAEGQFKDLEDILNEKKKIATLLPEKGFAILNADDPLLLTLAEKITSRKLLYGFSEQADLRVLEAQNTSDGLSFTLQYQNVTAMGVVPVLGTFQIYVVLPAVAVALTQGFTLEEAVKEIYNLQLPPGRMNPIPGINGSLIIDSSYNASPEAVKEALTILEQFPGRKIAVLGNMNELGTVSEEKHREIGQFLPGKTDMLITVGEQALWIQEEALKFGFNKEQSKHFDSADNAAIFLEAFVQSGDTILVKGSQNKVRLERLVKRLMKEPEKAEQLLARQEPEWEKII